MSITTPGTQYLVSAASLQSSLRNMQELAHTITSATNPDLDEDIAVTEQVTQGNEMENQTHVPGRLIDRVNESLTSNKIENATDKLTEATVGTIQARNQFASVVRVIERQQQMEDSLDRLGTRVDRKA